ncbi:MAG: hypothetical protein ACM3PU_01805 [Gemmatimonadota bacterium]
MQRNLGAHCIGAVLRRQQRLRGDGIGSFRQQLPELSGDRRLHSGIRLRLQRAVERLRIGAAPRRGGAHFGRRVSAQQLSEHIRIRRKRCHADHALRGVGMFMQGGTEEEFVQHSGAIAGSRSI